MVERGRDTGFLEEPGAEHVVGREFGNEHFQRDHVAEAGIACLVDDARPAAAEHPEHVVTGEIGADRGQIGHD
jgi:hypothetical protein